MSLTSEIKKRRMAAMKARNTVEKEILGVALGEMQTAAARAGADEVPDAEAQGILKKLVKSNREALEASSNEEEKAVLTEELQVIESLLPKALTPEQIAELLAPVAEQIQAAPNQGPAMGVAMKTLKSAGAAVEAPDVAKAVAAIRA